MLTNISFIMGKFGLNHGDGIGETVKHKTHTKDKNYLRNFYGLDLESDRPVILTQQRKCFFFFFFKFTATLLFKCFPVLIFTKAHAYGAIGCKKRKNTLKIMISFWELLEEKKGTVAGVWFMRSLVSPLDVSARAKHTPRHPGLNLRVHSHWSHSCRYQWMSRTAAKFRHNDPHTLLPHHSKIASFDSHCPVCNTLIIRDAEVSTNTSNFTTTQQQNPKS